MPVTNAGCTGCVHSVASEKQIVRMGVMKSPRRIGNTIPPHSVPLVIVNIPERTAIALRADTSLSENKYLLVRSRNLPTLSIEIVPKTTTRMAIKAIIAG